MADIPEAGEGKYTFADFTFDWEAELSKAYEKLKPYYSKMLELAGGDLDLAKRMIEFEYSQGMRESKFEYEQAAREQAITFPSETEQMITAANRRGIVGGITQKQLEAGEGGGLAGKEAGRLKESQAIRQEAIERALEDREMRLTKGKEFGTEKEERGYEREKMGLSREHEKEAASMTGSKFSREFSIAQAIEQKKQAEEQARIAQEGLSLTKKYYEKLGI